MFVGASAQSSLLDVSPKEVTSKYSERKKKDKIKRKAPNKKKNTKKNDNSKLVDNKILIPKFFLTVSDSVVEFDADGGFKYLSVKTSELSWQLSGIFPWCSKAINDSLIELNCKVNSTDKIRSESFYINAGNLSKKVTVIQNPLTLLEKGNWKKMINKVMSNVTSTYDNGKYKGEIYVQKERIGNKTVTSKFLSGLGVYEYADKMSYWGEFENGDCKGKGISIIEKEGDFYIPGCYSCRYFVGNWANDMKNGLGKCYDKAGHLIYFGNFQNNKPTEKYPQTHNKTYQFEYIECSATSKYFGETKNGIKEGLGIMFSENGDAWYGEWKEDKKNGKGIELLYNGSVKSGIWKANQYIEKY